MGKFQRKPFSAALILATLMTGIATAETPAPADLAQEEAYLDVLPKVEVPDDVQPIPGAVNEEFRNCEAQWPMGYKDAQSGPEARALRDIYGFFQARNVVASEDCTCPGKVANWEDVDRIAAALRERSGIERLGWQNTKEVAAEADRLTAIAETMCGGSF
ncbi:hypothetical protein IQ03_03283 [Gemmobacter caeni]|uniref:HdeA/HdeB family protein n=1 Tax=Gemmobacter caeni TaxID=589035 RepID=A0A2T6ATZ9_9RHOB|nr:hypothetical protein [Gemmobacter caeni]PTX47293.1 hypothetical protein C8N34_11349 [Gemmobacter caeni]TWI96405.1 hypothetical protein IQ03_03283 [Gemmobacter caeni]